jgi:hypothetical protein
MTAREEEYCLNQTHLIPASLARMYEGSHPKYSSGVETVSDRESDVTDEPALIRFPLTPTSIV